MVYHQKESLQEALQPYRKEQRSIGLVPTMGALHAGHLALMAASARENAVTVVSIFVNPTQFDNAADLEKYPRTLEEDVALIKALPGNFLIFNPTSEHLYEGNIRAKTYDFGKLAEAMEGAHRQGHFDGVGTVLNLLFRIVEPSHAYFGEKDYQQLMIVRKLVEIEDLGVEVVGCPIVREPNGVAMSSRNKRLSETQLEEATLLYNTLKEVQTNFEMRTIPELTQWAQEQFEAHPGIDLEYFEIADANTLQPVAEKKADLNYRAFVAAFVGPVRLIDNVALN